MDYHKAYENLKEALARPIKTGDWVKHDKFAIGEVLHTDGNLVTIKIVDSPHYDPGDVMGFNVVDLTILDTTPVEKKAKWDKIKKFQKKVKESKEGLTNIYEDMKYSADHAHAHLDRLVKLAKSNTAEFEDTVRYLKDVLGFLKKINWNKLKKS